jgi:hypothetical protein
MESGVTPHPIFEGPDAFFELSKSIAASAMEPPAFSAQFIQQSGANMKSTHAITYRYVLSAIHLMVSVDRLQGCRLASAQHLARWAMMLQRALRRNPKAPDFSGLDSYMLHAQDQNGVMATPLFDRHITEKQRVDGQFMKQMRLQRDEEAADEKRKKGQ